MGADKHEKKQNTNSQINSNINYPSSNLVYLTIKDEYDYELSRIQKTDTKINIGITFCSALFLFVVSFFDCSDLIVALEQDVALILPYNCYFTVLVVLSLSYIASFVLLLSIIRSRKYYHININELFTENLHKEPVSITEMFIAGRFKDSILVNRKISNKRMTIFNLSLVLIFIVILCTVILSCIKYNCFIRR